MNRAEGGRSRGYTIVETMIFLAVSAAMFISAMAFINGRQGRTQFSTNVRSFEASINDISSDVATGYYSSNDADSGNISCTVVGSGVNAEPKASASPGKRGANKGCILIGKAIQFAPRDSEGDTFVTIGLAGLQYIEGNPDKGDVTNIAQSKVQPLTKVASTDPEAKDIVNIGGGATIDCVLYAIGTPTINAQPCSHPGTMTKTDLVAFVSTFSAVDYKGDTVGSNQVDIRVPGVATSLNRLTTQAAVTLKDFSKTSTVPPRSVVPTGGVFVCLQSTGSNQYALVKLGGENSRFNVSTNIYSGKCS